MLFGTLAYLQKMDCFDYKTDNCDDVDFLNPIAIIEIKAKKKPTKNLQILQNSGIDNIKKIINSKTPKYVKSINYKFLLQFKTKSYPNSPSKKQVWLPNLGLMESPQR